MSSHTKPAVSTKKQQLVSDLHQPPAASKQPRVYTVEPIHFRELVQQLTGNHHHHHHRQQQPPAPRAAQTVPPRIQVRGGGDGGQATGAGEWCALSLLSPGSIAAMEQQHRAGL